MVMNPVCADDEVDDIVEECRLELDAAKASVGHLHRKITNLETALHSSRRIGAAIGIVMSQQHVTEDSAFELLRLVSERSGRKLRDVADEVVLTGAMPAIS